MTTLNMPLFFNLKSLFINNRKKQKPQPSMVVPKKQHVGKFDRQYVVQTIEQTLSDIKDTQLYTTLIEEAGYTKIGGCRNWSYAIKHLPKVMDCPFENIITKATDRLQVTQWVLWYNDGRVEILTPHQNKGLYQTKDTKVCVNDKADNMPDNVVKAAQITIGTYLTEDNLLRGFQWKLYNLS